MAVQLMHRAPQRGPHALTRSASSSELLGGHHHHQISHQQRHASPDLTGRHRGAMNDYQGHDEPRYENLDFNGEPIPTDVLMDQFAEIQPAYVTLLSRMTNAESTESAVTSEERPPAPLPSERIFLDDLVLQKLKPRQPAKQAETPTAAVQRNLGYEDTELGVRRSGPAAGAVQSSHSPGTRPHSERPRSSNNPSSANSPRPAVRPKPRVNAAGTSPAAAPRKAGVAEIAPSPNANRATSPAGGRKQLQKFEGRPTEWFHGVTTRKQADELLGDQPLGSFLVRIGERHLGYSLSVRGKSGNKHFMVTQRDEQEFQLGTNPLIHKSMYCLIDHFHHNALNGSGDMLSQALDYTTL